MAGLSIKGVESDHHITGAFERSRRHPHIHTTAVHDHVGLELLFESCKSHVLVCAEKNKKRRRCWENQRNDDEVDCRGVARGGSWGTREPPLVGLLLSKQPTIFR